MFLLALIVGNTMIIEPFKLNCPPKIWDSFSLSWYIIFLSWCFFNFIYIYFTQGHSNEIEVKFFEIRIKPSAISTLQDILRISVLIFIDGKLNSFKNDKMYSFQIKLKSENPKISI